MSGFNLKSICNKPIISLLNNSVMHITQDHYGRMYFMTEHGLTIYKDSVLASYENANHFSGNLFRHPSGKIFFNLD